MLFVFQETITATFEVASMWGVPYCHSRQKYMVIVSEFYHDLGHVADVAARNAEHKSGRTINQASSSGT